MVFVGGQIKEWKCFSLLLFVSVILYFNTFHAKFTFDDSFAVIYNGDVTDKQRWFGEVFGHDFWGQQITSRMSHKSYRPFTTLVYRMINFCHSWFYPKIEQPGESDFTPWISQESPFKSMLQVQNSSHKEDYRGLDPFAYHFTNVVLHGIVSYLVYRLAFRLLISQSGDSALESIYKYPKPIHASFKKLKYLGVLQNGSAKLSKIPKVGWSEDMSKAVEWQILCEYHKLRRTPHQLVALLAGLLFASHPVHTEAVAGIVGMAEILCALLGIPAFLCYMAAAEGRYYLHLWPKGALISERGAYASYLLLSVVLMLSASLTKEIGITMAGAMMLYDVFLCRGSKYVHIPRMIIVAAAAIMYVYLRNLVAGDHIVRIYRKVENPIPFADEFDVRFLTTGFLHARYFGQLVAPIWLSADWSYACIDYVRHMQDPRNLLTFALYAFLFLVVVTSWPWLVALEFLLRKNSRNNFKERVEIETKEIDQKLVVEVVEKEDAEEEGISWLRAAACNVVLIVGLMVGPFFPASNVLFYVGTFIGERLLYFPSVGYCIFLAKILFSILGQNLNLSKNKKLKLSHQFVLSIIGDTEKNIVIESQVIQQKNQQVTGQQEKKGQEQETQGVSTTFKEKKRNYFRIFLFLLFTTTILLAYSWKTVTRNRDWQDEGDLFLSAGQVCGESAKVNLNLGILQRRTKDWKKSLFHFKKAKKIEPTYCEPDYWIGLTMVSSGKQVEEGLKQLEKAIPCKYVAAETVQFLNNVYRGMIQQYPNDPSPLVSWAGVLMLPYMNRIMESCNMLEQAYIVYLRVGNQKSGEQKLQTCLDKLKAVEEGGDDFWVNVDGVFPPLSMSRETAKAQRSCVSSRKKIYDILETVKSPSSPKALKALYKYISDFGNACRTTPLDTKDPLMSERYKQGGEGGASSMGGYPGNVPQAHMLLVNKFQSGEPDDFWLQVEWGKVLIGEGRELEAVRHLEVGGLLLLEEVDKQLYGEGSTRLDIQGKTGVQIENGTRVAVEAFDLAVKIILPLEQSMQMDPCRLMFELCHAQNVLSKAVKGAEATKISKQVGECKKQLQAKKACKPYSAVFGESMKQGQSLTSLLKRLNPGS